MSYFSAFVCERCSKLVTDFRDYWKINGKNLCANCGKKESKWVELK